MAVEYLYFKACIELKGALTEYFGVSKESHEYDSLLNGVYLILAKRSGEMHEACSAVTFLREQHEFFLDFKTFNTGKEGAHKFAPSVDMLEKLIQQMTMVATELGLSMCVENLGSLLYSFENPRKHRLNMVAWLPAFPLVVDVQTCKTDHHLRLAKLAHIIAHFQPEYLYPELILGDQ